MKDKNSKIYIAGHKGLVGSAIKKELEAQGYKNLIFKTHEELDLTDFLSVKYFFEQEKPEYVFLSAAKVGGILGNSSFPVEFMLENLKIQNNIIENSYNNHVKKLLFLGSSCIYPKNAPQPIKESDLLSSELEKTNEAYALSKICGLKLCNYYNNQYNTDYISVMPCNLYGLNDNYNSYTAHVIPMLISRFHQAKINSLNKVSVWGTGTPLREFMYAGDLANAIVFLMQNKSANDIGECINIGTGKEISIIELAILIKNIIGFQGEIVFDETKPDGTIQKCLDISKINSFGWHFKTDFEKGLKLTYEDFLNNKDLRLN